MSDLIGRRVGQWTVIAKRERKDTPSKARAVYVLEHEDGKRQMGLRGQRLNALIQAEKRIDGEEE